MLALNVDISDAQDLADAIDTASKTMPPVKGVIQGAMVLQVCIRFAATKQYRC